MGDCVYFCSESDELEAAAATPRCTVSCMAYRMTPVHVVVWDDDCLVLHFVYSTPLTSAAVNSLLARHVY